MPASGADSRDLFIEKHREFIYIYRIFHEFGGEEASARREVERIHADTRISEIHKDAYDLGFDPPLFTDTVSLSRFHLRDPLVVMTLAARPAERGAAEGWSPDPIIAKIVRFS